MSRDAARLPDASARVRAATDFSTNLVVEAGAGTGKTSLLVERLLVAVGAGIAEIDAIAAITFTEKAAGEMRERLAAGLERLRALAVGEARDDGESSADRAFAWLRGAGGHDAAAIGARALVALERLDRATVTTIHGFCSELLRAHPLEARVDPDFAVDPGERAALLVREAWEAFLARELGPAAERAALWRALLARLDLRTVRDVAFELAGFGSAAAVMAAAGSCEAGAAQRRALASPLIAETDALLERAGGLTAKARAFFETLRDALTAFSDHGVPGYRAVYDAAAAALPKTTPSAPQRLTGVTPAAFASLARDLGRLRLRFETIDDTALQQLVEALAPFVADSRETLLRRGVVSFDGLLALARDLLRGRPDVRERLKRRYRLLLVDEFQDTDPLQYEIVLLLAEREGDAASNAFDARLAPGRLFIVGDAKQSIYRFRGADFSAYRAVLERVVAEGGARLDLVANFRSVGALIDPVNALFSGADGAWRTSPYQPDYVPILSTRDGARGAPRVELWTLDPALADRAPARRRAEAALVADSIARRAADDGIDFARISILFRSFGSVGLYLRALRERGVPFVVDGGKDFLERPEIKQFLATLRSLARPEDAPALLAFLRSPAGAAPDTELAAWGAVRGRWDWRCEPDPERFPNLARAFGRLRGLAGETSRLPADAVARRVLRSTDMLPLAAAAFEGAQRVANLEKLVAAAGSLARDGRLSLEDAVDALADGRLPQLETDSPLADEVTAAVRITSVHRMKGLENDWIYLPDLARVSRGGRNETVEVQAAGGAGAAATLALKAGDLRSSAHVCHEHEGLKHDDAEELRVLYVALTRAREGLVLLAATSKQSASWVEALAPWGYDPASPPDDGAVIHGGEVAHRRCEQIPAATRPTAAVMPAVDTAVARYEGAVQQLRESRAPFAAPSGSAEPATPTRGGAASWASRPGARALGALVHRALEVCPAGADPSKLPLEAWSEEIAGESAVPTREWVDEARALLRTFRSSTLHERWQSVEIVGRELPLLLEENGERWRGAIDLLYRDSDGTLVIADYKTDHESDPAALIARYHAQLALYVRAVTRALDLATPPRAELWLLRTGTIVAPKL